ncbi:MAG TPA: YHYH domain-containing protein [Thermoanaerobaculia bacterium]|nr:YHYH domain-containing protein [Thermoanaerobaculia bacterium]
MRNQRTILLAVLVLVAAPAAFAHGGGLDRNGCHTNRKTGEYHCHGAASAPAPPAPSRSTQANASPIRPASAQTLLPADRNRDLVRAAQVLLAALGYRPTLLGSLDERTKSAIREFQRAENIDGEVTVSEYLVMRLAEKVAMKCE